MGHAEAPERTPLKRSCPQQEALTQEGLLATSMGERRASALRAPWARAASPR
jgi:hypothetical protein